MLNSLDIEIWERESSKTEKEMRKCLIDHILVKKKPIFVWINLSWSGEVSVEMVFSIKHAIISYVKLFGQFIKKEK